MASLAASGRMIAFISNECVSVIAFISNECVSVIAFISNE